MQSSGAMTEAFDRGEEDWARASRDVWDTLLRVDMTSASGLAQARQDAAAIQSAAVDAWC